MIGKIIEIKDQYVIVQLLIDIASQANLINLHVVFEDDKNKIIGEIKELSEKQARIAIVGELVNDTFLPGTSRKPSFGSIVRMIKMEELTKILGEQQISNKNQVYFGRSLIYKNYRINVDTNKFFSNHFSIIGGTGSGKSYTVARLIQNIFGGSSFAPINSNIFMFDAYGEYTQALENISSYNPLLRYHCYTTDIDDYSLDLLKVPLWLLTVDDIAQLLSADEANQLPIIEKALRLVRVLRNNDPNLDKRKNDIIARALLDILVSGQDSGKIRDQVTAVLTSFNTKDLNLNSEIKEPGYVRTLKQCLFTDKTGKMQEVELVVNFISNFIIDDIEVLDITEDVYFTLQDLEQALDFALISEGVLKSDRVFDYANILSVRLHSLVNSSYAKYFECDTLMDRETYIRKLITAKDGKKAQIINFNINHVDDRMAKALVKIISRILFAYSVESRERAQIPFHIIIEEAHRYVQDDKDVELLGYNIFDRITKEGRKYGVILGLITQRPSELSETSLSQCSNFLILRTVHPKDLEFIRNMVNNISAEMIESLRNLQSGSGIAFGTAFRVPILIQFDKPNPEPLSSNADLTKLWY